MHFIKYNNYGFQVGGGFSGSVLEQSIARVIDGFVMSRKLFISFSAAFSWRTRTVHIFFKLRVCVCVRVQWNIWTHATAQKWWYAESDRLYNKPCKVRVCDRFSQHRIRIVSGYILYCCYKRDLFRENFESGFVAKQTKSAVEWFSFWFETRVQISE